MTEALYHTGLNETPSDHPGDDVRQFFCDGFP